MIGNLVRRALLTLLFLALPGCGTAVYHHNVRITALNAPGAQVGAFDHRMGYSHDWAHKSLGSSPYSTTIGSTATVTIASASDPQPLEFALALPDVSDDGYFMLAIGAPMRSDATIARFVSYGEYFPNGQRAIPLVVSAQPSKGNWSVEVTVDVEAAKRALGQ